MRFLEIKMSTFILINFISDVIEIYFYSSHLGYSFLIKTHGQKTNLSNLNCGKPGEKKKSKSKLNEKAHFNLKTAKIIVRLVNLLKSQHIVSDFFIVLFHLKIHIHTCYYGAIVACYNNETVLCIFSSFLFPYFCTEKAQRHLNKKKKNMKNSKTNS